MQNSTKGPTVFYLVWAMWILYILCTKFQQLLGFIDFLVSNAPPPHQHQNESMECFATY
jgi:hypothetical protein